MSVKPLVFSYQRFSSPQQAKGDSIRRQTAARDAFLQRNGLTLTEGSLFSDQGVSSYRGLHHKDDRYELARFLKLVKDNGVPEGSYLIVESLDRLSRENIQPALRLLLDLLEAGIRIVQLLPIEQIFDRKSEAMAIMMAIIELSRGNSESKMKSERVGAAWDRKRERARESKVITTSVRPLWLDWDGVGRKFVANSKHTATVQMIFELCADGFGINQIIKRLVGAKRPIFAKSREWSACYIGIILRSRSVLGEYQPRKGKKPAGDPIANYYPAVVSETLFYRAQASLDQRRMEANPSGRLPSRGINLFRGLLRHAVDGDPIEYKWFGKWARYCNSKSLCGLATHISFLVPLFEKAVLSSLTEIAAEEVLPPNPDAEDRVMVLTSQLETVNKQLQRIEDDLVAGVESVTLTSAAVRLETKKRELESELKTASADKMDPVARSWASTKGLISVLDSTKDPDTVRTRLHTALRRHTEFINCLFVRNGRREVAMVQLYFRQSDQIRTVVIYYRGELANRKGVVPVFLKWNTLKKGKLKTLDLRQPPQVTAAVAVLKQMVVATHWTRWVEPQQPPARPRPTA